MGKDPRHFVSMHNATYKEFPIDPTKKAGNEDIRKTHFILGKEGVPHRTTHQRDYTPKEGTRHVDSSEVARGF